MSSYLRVMGIRPREMLGVLFGLSRRNWSEDFWCKDKKELGHVSWKIVGEKKVRVAFRDEKSIWLRSMRLLSRLFMRIEEVTLYSLFIKVPYITSKRSFHIVSSKPSIAFFQLSSHFWITS